MEPLRVRVVFEDRHLLSKSQRRLGLRRSWVLLRPEMDTVAALASHIMRSFDLQETCPSGLLLSMDQFVLPPFESTEIFKDKDVIGVRKRGATLTEAIKFSQDANHIKDSEIIDKQQLLLCDDVVAAEEFEKESGGYESEDEENVGDQAADMVFHETPNGKTGSKRKRDSSRPSSSKPKKTKKTRPDEIPTVSLKAPGNVPLEEVHPQEDDVGRGIPSRRNRSPDEGSSSKKQNATRKDVAYTTEDKQIEAQESHQIKAAEVNASVSDQKIPSRSARRKKAKRQWLRKLMNSEKKELATSDKLENNDHPKSPAHHEDQDSGSEDFVPVVVRPGHIRFGPPGGDEQPSHVPVETLKWNGTTNKKKGQRWGRDEDLSVRMDNDDVLLEQPDVGLIVEDGNGSPDRLTEFEKLFPLTRAPKKGDMVAYKVVELSSSWCPELSSFRVGKVASFDPTSTKIVLDQVPGHPVSLRERAEEDELVPDTSLYKDDGSLEIDFPSLHDVRLFDNGKTANGETEPTDPSPAVSARRPALASSSDHEPNPSATELTERGPGDVWEEISRALEKKKGELSQKGWENWERKRPTTGGAAWSLRALRRSALGPTVSLLRSNNDI